MTTFHDFFLPLLTKYSWDECKKVLRNHNYLSYGLYCLTILYVVCFVLSYYHNELIFKPFSDQISLLTWVKGLRIDPVNNYAYLLILWDGFSFLVWPFLFFCTGHADGGQDLDGAMDHERQLFGLDLESRVHGRVRVQHRLQPDREQKGRPEPDQLGRMSEKRKTPKILAQFLRIQLWNAKLRLTVSHEHVKKQYCTMLRSDTVSLHMLKYFVFEFGVPTLDA